MCHVKLFQLISFFFWSCPARYKTSVHDKRGARQRVGEALFLTLDGATVCKISYALLRDLPRRNGPFTKMCCIKVSFYS